MRRKRLAPRRSKISDKNVGAVGDDNGCSSVGDAPVGENVGLANGEGFGVADGGEEVRVNDEQAALSGDDCEVVGDDDADESVDDVVDEQEDDVVVEEEGGECLSEDGNRNEDAEAASDSDSGYDAWNDDVIPDPLATENEEEDERRHENEDPDELLALGKTFGCADDVKRAILLYSLKTRYDIKLGKSSAMKVTATCSDTLGKCPWRVYSSYERRKRKLQIKIYVSEHICVRSGYSKMLKISSIATLFSERLRLNPKITKQEMAAEIKREYMLIVTDEQCGKAKSKLVKERKASHEQHFGKVWNYQAEIFQKNPGSTMEIETIPGPTIGSKQRFYSLYVCFKAQKEAWKQTCRPIIGVDGAFLKWDIKGHLLAAVGRDGDNRIVPIAWVVVEIENDTNWDWFITHLSRDLELGEGKNIAIISDKHKSILKAVKNILPQAEHRMCCKHVLDNWKRDSRDVQLQRLFWKIARSYTKGDYDENMEALKKYSPGAFESLQRHNPQAWSRAFYRIGSLCNDNLNNLCESFNRTIKEARRKPLLDMLEEIRRQCMERTAKRSIIANRLKTRFTKRAHDEIEKMKKECMGCVRYMAIGNVYEIDEKGCSYSVDMGEQTCGCRKWQMTGIPCVHATCVIIAKKQKVDDYVSEFYTTQMWRETYKTSIRPVEGVKKWPNTNRLGVLPPPWRLGNPGRPRNYERRKGANETASSSSTTKLSRAKRIMKCSNCDEEGHNIVTCDKPSVEPQPKRPRGRPRKIQGGTSEGVSQGQGVSQVQEVSQGQGVSQVQGSQVQGSHG